MSKRRNVEHGRLSAMTHPRREGVTLAELVAVVVVTTTLLLVAMPRYTHFVQTDRLRRAGARVAMDLRFAQAEAIKSQRYVTVQFSTGKSAYQTVYSSNGGAVPGTGVLYLGKDSAYRTALASVDFNGDAELVLDRFGMPRNGGTVTLGIKDLQVTVSVDAASGRVTVGSLGRVPSAALMPSANPGTATFADRAFIPPHTL